MSRTSEVTGLEPIERSVVIAASRERVWELISRPGWWINNGALTGHTLEQRGSLILVTDPELGVFPVRLVEIRKPDYAAFRWEPWREWPRSSSAESADDSGTGTLVEFWLRDVPGGVELTVRESEWETVQLPPTQLADKHRDNTSGWEEELNLARRAMEEA